MDPISWAAQVPILVRVPAFLNRVPIQGSPTTYNRKVFGLLSRDDEITLRRGCRTPGIERAWCRFRSRNTFRFSSGLPRAGAGFEVHVLVLHRGLLPLHKDVDGEPPLPYIPTWRPTSSYSHLDGRIDLTIEVARRAQPSLPSVMVLSMSVGCD
jgi:hypothetical protein